MNINPDMPYVVTSIPSNEYPYDEENIPVNSQKPKITERKPQTRVVTFWDEKETVKSHYSEKEKNRPTSTLKPPTITERWEEFQKTKTWKIIKPLLSPIFVISILIFIWMTYMATDYVIIEDGEAYSPKTKCQKPLILFKDSVIRAHGEIPFVNTQNVDYQYLNNILSVSFCYLQMYPKNMSCITPLAYGVDMRIISLRKKNGDIIHLINPKNPTKEEKEIKIPETSTLVPHAPPINVTRPRFITIDYMDNDMITIKTGQFDNADAFCVKASLELFDHVLPQALYEQKHTHN